MGSSGGHGPHSLTHPGIGGSPLGPSGLLCLAPLNSHPQAGKSGSILRMMAEAETCQASWALWLELASLLHFVAQSKTQTAQMQEEGALVCQGLWNQMKSVDQSGQNWHLYDIKSGFQIWHISLLIYFLSKYLFMRLYGSPCREHILRLLELFLGTWVSVTLLEMLLCWNCVLNLFAVSAEKNGYRW